MYQFYLGCYTHQNNSNDAEDAVGIYLLDVSEEGKLLERRLAAVQSSPSYFYMTKDQRILYAVTESPEEKGKIVSYRVGEKGELTYLSERIAAGGGLCHAVMDPLEKYLVVTCYDEATIQTYPIEEDQITPMFSLRHHIGSGPVLDRQEAAHAHSVTFTPEGDFAVVCDLGMDMLLVYTLNEETGKLHRKTPLYFKAPAGCGPRHMVFSPDGRFAYVACELSSEVLVLSYDHDTGFTLVDKVSTLSPEYGIDRNFPAAIRITKDGRFLYVSNRGEDTIACFTIDQGDGKIVRSSTISTLGWYPRDFILSDDEKLLIAANQLSDDLTIYRRDEKTGELTVADQAAMPYPMPENPIALCELKRG